MQYNHKHIIICTVVFCLMIFASCNKYLDVTPKGYTLLTTVANYDQWLNDADALAMTSPRELNLLADNTDKHNIPVPPSNVYDVIYVWARQYPENTYFWGAHYSSINKYNTVLSGIDKATGGTEEQKAALKAEALLGRAFEYWYLVNEYGPEFDSATADSDLAVPFVTSNDVSRAVPPRSTVKAIYDHIIADINEALPNLPLTNSDAPWRGSVAAAYSVLARVYFYAGDYTDAAKNAQLALSKGNAAMLDYNTFPIYTRYSTAFLPDDIYWRTSYGSSIESAITFVHSYDPHDIRLKQYATSDGYAARGNTTFYPLALTPAIGNTNFGTSVQEMKLIIAEAAARGGDLPVALQQLNDIRADRFPPAYYAPLQSGNRDTVLNWVLRERGFELPYCGLRWFDMRRLDKEGRMDTVYRYDAQNNIIATLPPHSPKYTMQIPLQIMRYHKDWPQNPWEQ